MYLFIKLFDTRHRSASNSKVLLNFVYLQNYIIQIFPSQKDLVPPRINNRYLQVRETLNIKREKEKRIVSERIVSRGFFPLCAEGNRWVLPCLGCLSIKHTHHLATCLQSYVDHASLFYIIYCTHHIFDSQTLPDLFEIRSQREAHI